MNNEEIEDITVEEFFPEGTVIMCCDPIPNKSVDEMEREIATISSAQELVVAFARVHNKFWYIEDDLYDYEKGSAEYEQLRVVVDAWGNLMDNLEGRIMQAARAEGLLEEGQPNLGTIKKLEPFMAKYGYRDGRGWWVTIED